MKIRKLEIENLLKRVKLRTWVSIGIIVVLSPILFSAAYGILGALGGSSATPIAHWAFDEGVDNTCSGGSNDSCDSSGNGYDMARTNAVWQTEDKCVSGKCAFYDGDTDYFSAGDQSAFDFAQDQDFSVSLWFKATSVSDAYYLISKGAIEGSDDAANAGFSIRVNNPTLLVSIRDQTSTGRTNVSGSTSLEANKWYHVVATFDRDGSATIYLNGVSDGSGSISSRNGSLANTHPFTVGTLSNSNSFREFPGFIDEVKVFNSVLTAAQVKAEFAGGAAVLGTEDNIDFLSDGLVGYFPMDDNVSGNAQTLTDRSGNRNNATTNDGANDTGMDCTESGKFGYACHFDGTDDFASIGDISAYKTSSKTIAYWGYQDDTATATEGVFSGGTANYYVGTQTLGRLISSHFITGDTQQTTYSNNNAITNGEWHHYVTSWEVNGTSVTVRHFVDGVINNETTYTTGYGTTYGTNFIIGAFSTSTNFYDGLVDELRIYNRTLTSAEVQSLANWAPGPVAYYKMDEASGTTTYDSSSNGLNGTTTAATYTQGKFGQSLSYNGSTTYTTVSDNASLDITNDITVEAWIKPSSTQAAFANVISKGGNTGNSFAYVINYNNDGSAIRFLIGDNNENLDFASSTAPSSGSWHHVAGVVNSTNIMIYIDGALAGIQNRTIGTIGSTDNPLCLGRYSNDTVSSNACNDSTYSGLLDEVRIYNYARTQQQIVEDMNGGNPTGDATLGSATSHWRFDEMQGDTANDSVGGVNGDLGSSDTTCPTASSDCPTWTSDGKFGPALSFDNGDYIDMGTDSSTDLIAQDFTVTAWVKTDQTGTTRMILQRGNGHLLGTSKGYQLYLGDSGTMWNFGVWDGTANTIEAETTFGVEVGAWHHLAGVFDASAKTAHIYVDGILRDSTTNTSYSTPDISAEKLIVGAAGNESAGNRWQGDIDEVKIYSSMLTADQIRIDYNDGRAINFGGGVNGSTDTIDGAITPPVAYWDFNEKVSGDGQTLLDKSGTGYSLTTNDGANNTGIDCSNPGKYGSACTFDGVDDYASIANPALDNFGTGEMSVSAWIKYTVDPDDAGQVIYTLVDNKSAGTNNAGFNLQVNTANRVQFRVANGSAQASALGNTTPLNDGAWHHLVGTFERGTPDVVSVYVDGILHSTANPAADGWNISSSQNLLIGAYGTSASNGNYSGHLDDVRIFDYALSPAQVAYEFNRGGPIGWWKFDECTGTTANDSSGNGKNGTITPGGAPNTSAGTCSSGTASEMWNDGTTGKYNGSLGLDGADDYVVVPSPTLPTGDFTISLWFKGTTVGNETLFHVPDASNGNELQLKSASNVQLFTNNSQTATSSSTLTAGTWYHLAATRNGSALTIYINGRVDGTGTDGTAFSFSTCSIYIGTDFGCVATPANPAEGQIDDVRIYGYALSADQIKNAMNEGKAVRF